MQVEEEADRFVHAVVDHWRSAPLSDADKALCTYAEKLTLDQGQIQSEDLDLLRSHGFDDRAIHDICSITAYYAFVNRIADGLGVELELSKK